MVITLFKKNRDLDGLFNYSRNRNQNLFQSFRVISASYYVGNSVCNIQGSIGGPPTSLIDGNLSTSWANALLNFDCYFMIDLGKKHAIKLDSIDFYIMCNLPSSLTVYASNDNVSWKSICRSTSFFTNTMNNLECSSEQYYRFWKIIDETSTIRLHFTEIDFYGSFLNREISTRKMPRRSSFFFYSLL